MFFKMALSKSCVYFVTKSKFERDFSIFNKPYNYAEHYIRALVVGDSRLWSSSLDDWSSINVSHLMVLTKRGGRTNDLCRKTLMKVQHMSCHAVVIKICFGLNDLLDGVPPRVVVNQLKRLKADIRNIKNNAMVTFAENYHLNLERYSLKTGREQRFSSSMINDRIDEFNRLVKIENRRICSPFIKPFSTPYVTNAIFHQKIRKNKFGQKYSVPHHNTNRLYDGIHPNDCCRQRIVRCLCASINKDVAIFLINNDRPGRWI